MRTPALYFGSLLFVGVHFANAFSPQFSVSETRSFGFFRMISDDEMQEKQEKRQAIRRDKRLSHRFACGKELDDLRTDVGHLRETLSLAQKMKDTDRCIELERKIQEIEEKDPEIAYKRALDEIEAAKTSVRLSEEKKDLVLKHWKGEARIARDTLPRFQLEGLWVGQFGKAGEQLVNVTYDGNTLKATKVTGDENVPRGKVSFTADLSPVGETSASYLKPLQVSLPSGNTTSRLPRYVGKGQLARPGFVDSRFVDGQLVMFEKHFSFVWVKQTFHVLFRRPTPEQTLKLLRNPISKEDELENMRTHLERCLDLDATDSIARHFAKEESGGDEPFQRIARQEDLERFKYLAEQEPEPRPFKFWAVHQWTKLIGNVLDQDHENSR